MALTGNKIDLILGLKLSEFFRQSKRVQLSYKKTKGAIEKNPIKVKEIGTQNMLKRLTQIGIAYVGLRKVSDDFRTSQTNLANVASLGVDNIEELGKGINRIAADVPVALHDIEAGLYDVVSAGVAATDQIDVLDQSARAAAAGLATTKDALGLGSAVIKGYGLAWGEFDDIMDKAFQTVKLGQTTFPELAASMGKVIPLASALGVDINHLFGSMATLTGVTGNAAEVATQLRGILAATAKPTADLSALFKEYGGAQAALRKLGLPEYLKAMADATGGNAGEMAKLVPRVEGLNAVLALGTKQYDTFIEKNEAMENATGSAADALSKQTETLDAKLIRLDNTFQLFSTSILKGFVPAITDILEAAGDLFKWFAELDEGTQRAVIGLTAFTVILLKLPRIITAIRTAIYALNASLGPTGWLIIGIGLAATAWGLYADNAEAAADANDRFNKSTSNVDKHLQQLAEGLKDISKKSGEDLASIQTKLYDRMIKAQRKGNLTLYEGYKEHYDKVTDLIKRRADLAAKNREAAGADIVPFNPADVERMKAGVGEAEGVLIDFYGSIGTVATDFYDLRAGEVEREYMLRTGLLEHYMSEQLRTHGEGSIAYQELMQNKIDLDRGYFHAKRLMEENAARATVQIGSQLMAVFQGQNQALFEVGKALTIANLLVTKGEAIARAFKDYPWPFNLGIAALQGALVAGQIAAVSSVQFKPKGFGRGGQIGRDDVYGYPYIPAGEDGIIAAQIGETVMNRGATRMFRPILEDMNSKGLRGFASGGTVEDVTNVEEQSLMMAAAIEDAVERAFRKSTIHVEGEFITRGRDMQATLDKNTELKERL